MSGSARPLKVAIVAPRSVPPVEGGAERHWRSLVAGLRAAGHDAELLVLDTPEHTLVDLLASYRRFHDLDVSAYDVVISGKYPSWMVRHPRHLRHLNHPLRGLYDLYPRHLALPSPDVEAEVREHASAGVGPLLDWAEGEALEHGHPLQGPWARAVVWALDQLAAEGISVHAAVSETVAARPGYLPERTSIAIIPPLTDLAPRRAAADERPPYVLAFGRLAPEKRTTLAIQAMARVRRQGISDIDLIIAGDGEDRPRLAEAAATVPGVELVGRVTDDELADLIAGARAIVATARDEDYGLVAAEAHAARRPVITTSDSGGLAEQVLGPVGDPGGIVVAPRARSLAAAIARLAADPVEADRLGRAGRDQLSGRSWKPLVHLVEELGEAVPGTRGPRPRILILSPLVAEPVTGGGARRVRATAAHLARDHEVRVLALTNEVPTTRYRLLDDGVTQIAVARSTAHRRADHQMATIAGIPVDDIGLAVLHAATPEFAEILQSELAAADLVILAHPFLAPALKQHQPTVPVVYDAYNVEIDLKAQLLEGRSGRTKLMAWCEQAEGDALALASLVSATSATDLARLCPPGCGHRSLVAANGVERALVLADPDGRRRARARLLADLGLVGDQRPILLFVGSAHPPNQQAADVLAELGAMRPDWLVVLAGSVSEAERRGAVSLGRFADHALGRLFSAADVLLNPVMTGSGTNLKLIEGLATGTPVVASPVGVRGLASPDDVVEVIHPWGSGPLPAAAIEAAVERVLGQPGPTQARVEAGRALASEHLWERTLAPLGEAIRDLVGLALEP